MIRRTRQEASEASSKSLNGTTAGRFKPRRTAKRAKKLPVAYLTLEGEQHGFRKAENIKRVLEAQRYFYTKVFGFDLADPVEPVEIENLQ